MAYGSCCLADQSQHYDDDLARHIAKMAKRLEVQLKLQMFDGSNPITILSFLLAFQMACDTNITHAGVSMWLFPSFVKKPACAALSARTCLTSSRPSR